MAGMGKSSCGGLVRVQKFAATSYQQISHMYHDPLGQLDNKMQQNKNIYHLLFRSWNVNDR